MKRVILVFFVTLISTIGIAQTVVTGVPGGGASIVAKISPTTTTSTNTVGPTTFYTTSSAGVYRISCFVDVVVAGTAGTYQCAVNFTSDAHSFTQSFSSAAPVTSQWQDTLGTNPTPTATFYADSGTAIKYQISASGVTGSPTVRYTFTLEQLQ